MGRRTVQARRVADRVERRSLQGRAKAERIDLAGRAAPSVHASLPSQMGWSGQEWPGCWKLSNRNGIVTLCRLRSIESLESGRKSTPIAESVKTNEHT